jgi:hypothetical protein
LITDSTNLGEDIRALLLIISIGNDDLRGGSNPGDNCDVIATPGRKGWHKPAKKNSRSESANELRSYKARRIGRNRNGYDSPTSL